MRRSPSGGTMQRTVTVLTALVLVVGLAAQATSRPQLLSIAHGDARAFAGAGAGNALRVGFGWSAAGAAEPRAFVAPLRSDLEALRPPAAERLLGIVNRAGGGPVTITHGGARIAC